MTPFHHKHSFSLLPLSFSFLRFSIYHLSFSFVHTAVVLSSTLADSIYTPADVSSPRSLLGFFGFKHDRRLALATAKKDMCGLFTGYILVRIFPPLPFPFIFFRVSLGLLLGVG